MPAAASSCRAYHHGGLREALVQAAVELVEELGPERVTVREAARRAGVSSGAPFRHFTSRTALMTAVAEAGMLQLSEAIARRLSAIASDHPLVRLSGFADAYFDWAVANPTHYRVLAGRTLIDFEGSEVLSGRAAAIRADMTALFETAQRQGLLRPCNPSLVHLEARALSYGLARMCVDAHLREWPLPAEGATALMRTAMDDFIVRLAVDPDIVRAGIVAARAG